MEMNEAAGSSKLKRNYTHIAFQVREEDFEFYFDRMKELLYRGDCSITENQS